MRLKIIPAIENFANPHFRVGVNSWFDPVRYGSLKRALGWPKDSARPCWLASLDRDKRHSMNSYKKYRLDKACNRKPRLVDRRTIPEGSFDWIAWKPEQVVPSAEKVPDCVQQPIEMVFSAVKRDYHEKASEQHPKDVLEMWQVIKDAFMAKATKERICRLFDHAWKSLTVWSGREGTWVEFDGHTYMCTGGNIVPKLMRA
jgi:hypothetical protein